MQIGIFTTDADLIVRTWDAWLANATHIPAETACGQPLPALFPQLERPILARFQRVLADGVIEVLAPAFHRYLFRCAPQEPARHFDAMQQYVTIAPLRDNDQIVGTLVTIEDVTARRERERDLADDLSSQDEQTRLRAAEALADEPAAPASLLIDTLDDTSWRVRKAAAQSLAQHPDPDVVAAIVRTLRDDHRNPSVMNSALQALALLGADAVASLIELLSLPDADLRIYVALALGEQRDPRVAPALLHALADPDMNVRYHAIESLGQIGAPEAADALAAVAASGDFFLAYPALAALARIGEPRIAARIVPLLNDQLLCEPAASALGQLGDLDSVAPLTSALNVPGAPVLTIAQALAAIYDRYETAYREGWAITDHVRQALTATGTQNLLDALPGAQGNELRPLALVLGWLEGAAVEHALVRLMALPDVRGEIVEALLRHGARVVDLLVEQLAAEDLELRQAAVAVLGRIGSPSSVPALIGLLSDDAELAVIAAGALAKIGDRRAFEPLLGLLGDPSAALRRAAVGALNSLGHPDMAARVEPLLHDPDVWVRESAVKIAGYFGYANCIDALLACCHDADELVRRAAVEHLAYLEDPRAFLALEHALYGEAPAVRAAAARAFGYVDDPRALAHMLAALDDADAWVRYYAARALGRQTYPEAIDALARSAQLDQAQQVRIAALAALGQIGGARVVVVLAPLAVADSDDLARAALGALGEIGHPDAQPPLLAALRSPQSARRVAAANALGRPDRDTTAIAALQRAAADADALVVVAAIAALTQIATAEAIAALLELAIDPARRDTIIAALARLDEQHIELLARGLTHEHVLVRRVVVEALARMKRQRASEYVVAALNDPEPAVRLAATTALGHLGNHIARQQLVRLAHSDPDLAVRHAAQTVLGRT